MTRRYPVIAGFGHTEFSTDSGRSERELVIDAINQALDDAGLGLGDVDGLATYDLDTNDPIAVSNELALPELTWFSRTPYGGGQVCALFQDAALAIKAKVAKAVVIYRAANMSSGKRYGRADGNTPETTQYIEWSLPNGLQTPAHMSALWMHRYLHERGLTNADLGHVVVSSRRYASNNPQSRFHGRDYTMAEYLRAPWVVEPVLRVPDCCLENDGAVAFVVTRSDRARDGNGSVIIRAAARGMARKSSIMQNYYGDGEACFPDLRVVLRQLWKQSGLTIRDADFAIIYDAFSPYIFAVLEELGVADRRELSQFVANGGIDLSGALPVNPNGGQLSEAYIHGFNGIVEAVKQFRECANNQVASVEHALVTGGPSLPTSGMILSQAITR